MAVESSNSKQRGALRVVVLFAVILIAVVDLLVWRAAIGALMSLIASIVWVGFAWAGPTNGKGGRVVQRLGLGIGTLVLSLMLGLMIDRLNEGAARSLSSKALAYKTEHGVYPPVEIANAWARPVFGYTQRYSLTGTDSAYIWFMRFNYRLQSVAVAIGQVQEERDQ